MSSGGLHVDQWNEHSFTWPIRSEMIEEVCMLSTQSRNLNDDSRDSLSHLHSECASGSCAIQLITERIHVATDYHRVPSKYLISCQCHETKACYACWISPIWIALICNACSHDHRLSECGHNTRHGTYQRFRQETRQQEVPSRKPELRSVRREQSTARRRSGPTPGCPHGR